jgi:hypothetical protein
VTDRKRIVHDKLVRDHIREIILRDDRQCGTEILSEAAYRAALLDKFVEEGLKPAMRRPSTCLPSWPMCWKCSMRCFPLSKSGGPACCRSRRSGTESAAD